MASAEFISEKKLAAKMFLCLLAIACVSCSKQPEPIHVSGTITFGGKPVPKGIILIHPNRQKGNSGPFGIAVISGGKFDTKELKGRGAMPGAVKFAVTGYGEGGTAEDFSDAPRLFPSFQLDKDIGPDATAVDIVV